MVLGLTATNARGALFCVLRYAFVSVIHSLLWFVHDTLRSEYQSLLVMLQTGTHAAVSKLTTLSLNSCGSLSSAGFERMSALSACQVGGGGLHVFV